jgi:Cu(I)/Ag(I) efflux system membrane protein CusA/SilA
MDKIKDVLVTVSPSGSMGSSSSSLMNTMGSTGNQNTPVQNSSSKSFQVPLGELADIKITSGPPMIASENNMLRSVVFLNVRGRDMGGFVEEAKDVLDKQFVKSLPKGYYYTWSGQWENQIRAKKRLEIVMPIVFLIIFVMLYFVFKNILEAVLVMLSVPFALIGGIYLMALLNYNFSVAIWVGFIALYGVAVETGVVMVIYLHEALDKKMIDNNDKITNADIVQATKDGAVLRLRPKLMTVAVNLIGLIPIMWATGTGSDLAKPIAVPMIGGIVTSAVHVLLVTPIIFVMIKTYLNNRGKLHKSDMAKFMVH